MSKKKAERFTTRQKRFADEYLVDLNATKAALRAGYSVKGARRQGSAILKKPHVAEYVERALAKRAKRVEISADEVLKELAQVAFANPGDYFDWGPDGVKILPKDDLTLEQQAVVGEVFETKTKDGGTVRVKLHDKMKALELLGKHLGILKEVHEHGGPGGTPIVPVVNVRIGDKS